MPTGAFILGGDSDGDATGARTARAANDTIGTLETSSVITALANTNPQNWGHRRFVSAPLAAHTFANADGNWTFSIAANESNTNHAGALFLEAYCWRPSSGAQVGTTGLVVQNALTAAAKTAYSNTGAWNSTSTTIIDGDILVFEVIDSFTQSMGTAYTSTFYYDGTTEASTTSCASFVTPPAALTLFSGTVELAPSPRPLPFQAQGRNL